MGSSRARVVAFAQRHGVWLGLLVLLLALALGASILRLDSTALGFSKRPPGPPLVIYEQYHSTDAWYFLHDPVRDPMFKGLCQSPGYARPFTPDIDATKVLEILHDAYYQDLMCEYSGFFALTADFDRLHTAPWIGFQSWRARNKNKALTPLALAKVMALLEWVPREEVFYFWSHHDGDLEMDSQLYEGCNYHHRGNCTVVYAKVLELMFGTPVREADLPPMPRGNSTYGASWAYMSYFIMPRATFLAYINFVRMLFVAMDAAFYEAHHDRGECPLGDRSYERRHCWCYLLERFVNIWTYHRGMRMVYVDHVNGTMEDVHPLAQRQRKAVWFDPRAQAALERNFTAVAATFPHGLSLYRRLFLQADGSGGGGVGKGSAASRR